MKILNLKIKTKDDVVIRDIDFAEIGISFIYGDTQDPKSMGKTSNSLGKTQLLYMIDSIFGSDDKKFDKQLNGYILIASVSYNSNRYTIQKTIGDENYYVSQKVLNREQYRDFFEIERRLYNKQVILRSKLHKISQNTATPSQSDYVDFLRLLHFTDLVPVITDIYDAQDKRSAYKKAEDALLSLVEGIKPQELKKKFKEQYDYVNSEIERLASELDLIQLNVANLEIAEMTQDIVHEYAQKNEELKENRKALEHMKIEQKRLSNFIESSNKVDITASQILLMYNMAKQAVPEMIKKELMEVEEFHKNVYEDRKNFLKEKIADTAKEILSIETMIKNIANKVNTLGQIISTNDAYQSAMANYEKYNKDLQELKYLQGQLSQIIEINKEIAKLEERIRNGFTKALKQKDVYDELHKTYKDFMKSLARQIYTDDEFCYFEIEIKNAHMTNRPISLEANIKGDSGESVNEVLKNMVDYLIFRYNGLLEILVQDSSCFHMDPRQIVNIFNCLNTIATELNKQAIVAINKYQLGDYNEMVSFVEKNSAIKLSESDKLLKIDY